MKIYKLSYNNKKTNTYGVSFHIDYNDANQIKNIYKGKESIEINEIEIPCETKEEALEQGFLYSSETI